MRKPYASLLFVFLGLGSHAQSGLIHHWPLDESAGNVAQDLVSGSTGLLQAGALWAPGQGYHGGAVRTDGVDDRVLLGPCDLLNGSGGITLSLWVKPDFVTAMERTLIAKTSGPQTSDHIWSIAFVNATALRFRLRTAGTVHELSTPPSSLFGGTWYHIVASYDGSMMRLYVNGSLMAFAPASGSIGVFPAAPASLGARSTGAAPFSGWLDDVRIFDRGLSEPEILGILLGSVPTALDPPQVITDARSAANFPETWSHLRIMDLAGRTLREHGGGQHVLIPRMLDDLPTGIHLLQFHAPDGMHVRRVLVE
ncbi:MAG: LamG domain-containing protein [Flavobacteriales bacterium]|nr:LamG domain-containing protein [Flavobacteriales bacterium]